MEVASRIKEKTKYFPSLFRHVLTLSPSLVSQSEKQAKLLHDFSVIGTLGLLASEQLSLCRYSVGVISITHSTLRVCLPLPHDLEQSDHGVVCHLCQVYRKEVGKDGVGEFKR